MSTIHLVYVTTGDDHDGTPRVEVEVYPQHGGDRIAALALTRSGARTWSTVMSLLAALDLRMTAEPDRPLAASGTVAIYCARG